MKYPNTPEGNAAYVRAMMRKHVPLQERVAMEMAVEASLIAELDQLEPATLTT